MAIINERKIAFINDGRWASREPGKPKNRMRPKPYVSTKAWDDRMSEEANRPASEPSKSTPLGHGSLGDRGLPSRRDTAGLPVRDEARPSHRNPEGTPPSGMDRRTLMKLMAAGNPPSPWVDRAADRKPPRKIVAMADSPEYRQPGMPPLLRLDLDRGADPLRHQDPVRGRTAGEDRGAARTPAERRDLHRGHAGLHPLALRSRPDARSFPRR